MEGRAIYVRVGLMLVLGVGIAVGLLLFLSRGEVREGWKFESYFRESVQGLEVGAPVKLRGVTVGQVSDITLVTAAYPAQLPTDTTDPSYRMVVVRLTVDPKKVGPIRKLDQLVADGLRTRIASQGITGLSYIELDFVDPALFPFDVVPWSPRDAYLPSMPSTIARVQDAAEALAAKLQTVDFGKLSASAQIVLDDLHGQLTSGDAHATMAEAQGLLRDLRATLATSNIPALTAEFQAGATAMRNLAQGAETRELIRAVTITAQRLQPMIVALGVAVKHADDGIGDLQHDLAAILRDARLAIANLRETSETLRRNPSAVLFGAPPPLEGKR